MVLVLICLLLLPVFSGCLESNKNEPSIEVTENHIERDAPSLLPEWTDGVYHDYDMTTNLLVNFEQNYPNLVEVFSIGKSVLDQEIWCICITNEENNQAKYSCLIDGCIHGCEWEAGEACLYLSEYLLINFDLNATVTEILNTTEIYIVPLLNPDGRQQDDRFNANGIDLNRNFDVDFGRIRGGCIPLGKILNRIKIQYIKTRLLNRLLPNFPLYLTNCGRRSFSEPESQALRDLSQELTDFSFYVNCHTTAHCILGPWGAFKPPFEMTSHEIDIYTTIEEWITTHTEYTSYRSGDRIKFQGREVYFSGTSTDWFFKAYHIPSITFEILSEDYEMYMGQGKHDHLVHWMKTTLPVFLYLLVNIEHLHAWKLPTVDVSLPEDVPPEPLT